MLEDVDAPPVDEDLASGGRRPWLGLALLAVALVAGLLAVRFVESSDHPSRNPIAHRVTHPVPLTAQRDCPPAGDGQTICTTSPHVPAAVLAAVQARFPQAQQVGALEERLRDVGFGPGGVWYRSLRADSGGQSIVVVVRHRTADDGPPFTRRYSAAGRIEVTRLVGRRAVVVAVTGPTTELPAVGVVRALAGDSRLLTAVNT